MDDPVFMSKLTQAVQDSKEMDWLNTTFAYQSDVQLNETPIINFRNYRYKIVEIFNMTYKQEKSILDAEIATPDLIVVLGTYAEYKLSERLIELNDHIDKGQHSWNKILALVKNDVRLLVNMAFAVMHLFAGDMVALSDNEIVYCYILAAAVIATIDKPSRTKLDREIQKRGLKRPQPSISERPQSTFANMGTKIPKESSRSESAYIQTFNDILCNSHPRPVDENRKIQASQVEIFIAAARRLSVRKACLQSLAEVNKDLPQVGRLLHLGRTEDVEPNQLCHYIGKEQCALPASNLGEHRYKKPDTRSVYKKSRW